MKKKFKFLGRYRRDTMAAVTGVFLIVFIGLLIWAGMPWVWGLLIFLGYLGLFVAMRNNP
jgi:hypothetical protein